MSILVIIFLILCLSIALYILFKLLSWILVKRARIKALLIIIIFVTICFVVKKEFFTSMVVIQSKVYSNLYLIKNIEEDTTKVSVLIKETIQQHYLNSNEKMFETDIKFYLYTNFWNSGGDAGTVHFIENKEDPGGWSSEELINYADELKALVKITSCKNEVVKKCAVINYYKNRERIHSETLELIVINK